QPAQDQRSAIRSDGRQLRAVLPGAARRPALHGRQPTRPRRRLHRQRADARGAPHRRRREGLPRPRRRPHWSDRAMTRRLLPCALLAAAVATGCTTGGRNGYQTGTGPFTTPSAITTTGPATTTSTGSATTATTAAASTTSTPTTVANPSPEAVVV